MILRRCNRIQCVCAAVVNGGARCIMYSLFVLPFQAFALSETDSLSTNKETVASAADDEAKKSKAKTVSFRPEDVQVQKRYRPTENDSLFPTQWWRRLYVGVGGGYQWLSDNVSSVGNGGFNAYLGYRFTPVHSLRVHGSMSTLHYAGDQNKAKSATIGIDYLANLTNFAWGFDRSRVFDLSTLVGAGIRMNGGNLSRKTSPYAYIGLHADMHLNGNFAFFVEPYVGMQRGMDDLFGRTNREPWNLMYGANVGLQMTLDRRHYFFAEADSIYRNFFFDSSIGVAIPGRFGGLLHRSGTAYQVAFGLWFNPILGMRLGVQAQTGHWLSYPRIVNGAEVRLAREQALVGGRLELMVDPMNFSKRWRNTKGGHDFDLNLLAGVDYGMSLKADGTLSSGMSRNSYYGFTGAIQALYRISKPGTYIFVEPRYLAAVYNTPDLSDNINQRDVAHRVSFSVGTRLYMTKAFRSGTGDDEFEPRWWAGLDVGGVKWQKGASLSTGGLGINPTVGFSVGYDWKRYASFRAQLSYQRLYNTRASSYSGYSYDDNKLYKGSALWNSAYDLLDLRLSYMLNLNNVFQGYDSDRRFNLWLTAGPTVSYLFNQSDTWVEDQSTKMPSVDLIKVNNSNEGKVSPGVSMSLMAALRVAPRYEITAEAFGQYNFIHGVNPVALTANRPTLNSIKYGLTVGSRYYFDEDRLCDFFRATDAKPWQKGWELTASYGWALPLGTGLGMHASGSNMAISAGYWFNGILGARMGVESQQTYYRKFDYDAVVNNVSGTQIHAPFTWYQSQLMVGGRVELMLNPLNFIRARRERESAPRWDMALSAGMNFGGMHKTGSFTGGYVGFTASAALLYRLSKEIQLFVEPRYNTYGYSRHNAVMDFDESFSDRMFTVSVGTRVMRPVGEGRESKRMTTPDQMTHRGWWLAGSFGGSKMIQSDRFSTGGTSIQPSVTLSGGYDLTRLSGFRANLGYDMESRQFYGNAILGSGAKRHNSRAMINNKYHMLDVQLLYMLNLTNLWTGNDKRNALNMYFEAGPIFSTIMGHGRSLADGEYPGESAVSFWKSGSVGKCSFGLATGILMAMPVHKHWDITAEVMGQYYIKRSYMPKIYSRYTDDIKITFGLGTRYNF